MSSKVTIITPTCNRLDGLKEAVRCVLGQSYSDWEYFIVSDGYDSRVRNLVKSLGDKRIRYLFTLKTAYAGHLQRNVALNYATGEYVFCLDDDNLIERDYVEKMVKGFASPEIGYAVCEIKYDNRGILSPPLPPQHEQIDMLNYMVRTKLARRVGGWVPFENWSADFLFIERVSKISQGAFVPEVLGWHRNLSSPSSNVGGALRAAKVAGEVPGSGSRRTGYYAKATKPRKCASHIVEDLPSRVVRQPYIFKTLRELIIRAGLRPVIERILAFFGLKFFADKSLRINVNRLIYQWLCKVWIKF